MFLFRMDNREIKRKDIFCEVNQHKPKSIYVCLKSVQSMNKSCIVQAEQINIITRKNKNKEREKTKIKKSV